MENNKQTCSWPKGDPLLTKYHDTEWGVPLHNDRKLFEFLILEGFQAGLSWLTILRKRENFRKAFDKFDFNKVANYEQQKIDSLLQDSGIIRNKLKIESAVTNAKAFIEVRKEFGSFNKYIWGFTGGKPIQNEFESLEEIPAKTELSDLISKDLIKRGFKFVGSTIVYAHMQATGMVNDHIKSCFRHKEIIEKYAYQI
jgi:DNA-3-methyladenine glycosylase I